MKINLEYLFQQFFPGEIHIDNTIAQVLLVIEFSIHFDTKLVGPREGRPKKKR